MTSPALNPYQTDDDQRTSPYEDAAVAAVAVFLASVVAVRAVTLPASLVQRLTALGLSQRAVKEAAYLTLEPPLTGRTRWGSPTPLPGMPGRPQSMARRMAVNEPRMRALYLLAAAKRLTKAALAGELVAGKRREQNYLDAHRQAGRKRAQAARAYDKVARRHAYLMWVTADDDRVDATCRSMAGSIWRVDNPPPVIPGAVHARCRCRAAPVAQTAPSGKAAA